MSFLGTIEINRGYISQENTSLANILLSMRTRLGHIKILLALQPCSSSDLKRYPYEV